MIFDGFLAEKQRKQFIQNCIRNDSLRLSTEVFPANCDAECDILYENPDIPEHKLDIYKLKGTAVGDTVFFLVHGGAFVYGNKELDKNFGMTLAVFSEIPVVNVNYHLMPQKSLSGILKDLCAAIDFIYKQKGIRKLHVLGDSAGGFLAVLLACVLRNKDVRHEMGVFVRSDVEVISVNSICGVYDGDPRRFPGYFFKKPIGTEDGDIDIPDYVYDLRDVIKRTGLPRTCLVTGDRDFLHDTNVRMKEFLEEEGIPVKFYEAISSGNRSAEHVYAISDPAWQESHTALKLIISNACG